MKLWEDNIKLYCGDAISMAPEIIGAGTVDLIFTDPLYLKEYHYLYEWLAKEAVRVLKPTGFLIAYAGPYWKQRVMETLRAQLDYFYDFILIHADTSILWPRKIVSGYKSLLCYCQRNEKPLPRMNVLGKYAHSSQDKRFHNWGQSDKEARYYIDCFTKEGDLVVDYFLGGGTTAVVCKRLNRRCIGFEIDPATFEIARARVDGGLGPTEKGRQEIMAIE